MAERDRWGSDVPISRPVGYREETDERVDLGGMVFGPMGLYLPGSQALMEARYTPQWGPAFRPSDRSSVEETDG